ncbi:MaoC family dehydratase [Candidatus Pacearchaeota archaeon]|nr:MaoC family dehydratase [Candidatus Pacearchaeota archaeon]
MSRFLREEKGKEVLASINGITLTREDIAKFGDVVHDYSPIHRDVETAKKHGFIKDTPVIGVHLAAIGGRISRNLLSIMQTPDKKFYFTTKTVTFRAPVYPGEQINWIIEEEQGEEDSRSYSLIIPNAEPEKKPGVELLSEFKTSRPSPQTYDLEKLVYREEIEITPKEVKEFYEGLREEPLKEVPFSLGIARIPSTLLSFVGELNKIHGTNIGGKNIEMKSTSYEDLQTGKGRVDIYEVLKKGRGNRVSYIFQGVLYQNEQPIMESEITTMTNGEIDIRSLRPRHELAA